MKPLSEHDPTSVGEWELIGRIASGGMGEVYLARRQGEFAAVKVIRSEKLQDAEARERFRIEADALGRVRSPHVIRLLDADATAARPWLAMAYEPATNLDVTVARSGPFARKHGLLFLAKLAAGVEALHDHSIVHRDLKPTNVLVTDDGPRIIDFGIVKTEYAEMTGTFAPRTAQWASPEQIKAQPEITDATDVFNLGLVAAYCLSAEHPFGSAESQFELAQMYLMMGEGDPQNLIVDDDIADVLMQCFGVADERPSPSELSRAFANLARGQSVDAARGDYGSSVGRVRARRASGAVSVASDEYAPDQLADWYAVFPRSLAGQSSDETLERLVVGLDLAGVVVETDEDGQPFWDWSDAWFSLMPEPEAGIRAPKDLWLWLEGQAKALGLARGAVDLGGRIVHCSSERGGRLYVAIDDDVREGRVHLVALESTPERAPRYSDEIQARFPRHGKTWTEVEEQQLADAFLEGTSLEALIASHGRTPSALCARLEQQGVVLLLMPALTAPETQP